MCSFMGNPVSVAFVSTGKIFFLARYSILHSKEKKDLSCKFLTFFFFKTALSFYSMVFKKLENASLMWVLRLSAELVTNLPRYCWLLLKSYLECLE